MKNDGPIDAQRFDLAIVGDDLAACLLSLALHLDDTALKIALLSANSQIGGDQLELVLPDRLAPSFARPLAPMTIREWPACAVRSNRETRIFEEKVCLIDPMQVWLELSQRAERIASFAGCRDVAIDGETASWNGGRITAASVIDLRFTSRFPRDAEIVEAGMFSNLSCPVIADYDMAGERWRYLQYVPLGTDRALINRIGHARVGSEDPKSALDDLASLPTVSPLRIAAAVFDERRRAVSMRR